MASAGRGIPASHPRAQMLALALEACHGASRALACGHGGGCPGHAGPCGLGCQLVPQTHYLPGAFHLGLGRKPWLLSGFVNWETGKRCGWEQVEPEGEAGGEEEGKEVRQPCMRAGRSCDALSALGWGQGTAQEPRRSCYVSWSFWVRGQHHPPPPTTPEGWAPAEGAPRRAGPETRPPRCQGSCCCLCRSDWIFAQLPVGRTCFLIDLECFLYIKGLNHTQKTSQSNHMDHSLV